MADVDAKLPNQHAEEDGGSSPESVQKSGRPETSREKSEREKRT